MKYKQDAFGNFGPQTKTVKLEELKPAFYGLLLLNCELSISDIPNLIWKHTRLMFRPFINHKFTFQDKGKTKSYIYPTYAYNAPNKDLFAYFIENQSEEHSKELISFQKDSIFTISSEKKTLPNQLALFPEEKEPIIKDNNDYANINEKELTLWNEIGAFLMDNSVPISKIQYVMPISIHIGEMLYPFFIHLSHIEAFHYKFITGSEINNIQLFYLLESYRNDSIVLLKKQTSNR